MLFHEQSQSLVFRTPDPFYIRELLPKSIALPSDDYNIAVKHTLESTKVLRNIGIDAPAPIRYQYDWPGKYKPYDHQIVMAEFMTLHKRCFNLSEMGTMKTAATLWAADWLMRTGRVHKALIISPLSTIDSVWNRDIFDVLMHRSTSLVHGSREKRERAIDADVDFYILNHDGVSIKWLRDKIKRRADIDLIIVDEASMFRNHDTRKFKDLRDLVRQDQRLWLLTGTPCPNEPTDAWALARLVNPSRVPNYFGQFRRQTMIPDGPFKWVARRDAYDIAYKAMQPAVRFKKNDCVNLPPVVWHDRQVKLTKEQREAFEAMRKEMQIEAATTTITAVNAADKINKLRQILCGAIHDPTTATYSELPHHYRTKVLVDTIQQAQAKVLVVVPFKGIINYLNAELSQMYSVEILNGDIPIRRRVEIVKAFKTCKDPHVLLCHPKVMAHGLNFVEADTLIFYAPIYSNDEFRQVIERFNRMGQTRTMNVVRMAAHPLEWEIYKLVDNRNNMQSTILNLFKAVTE